MLNTHGLGAGQYVNYGRFITRGIAAPEWFNRVAVLSFLARTTGWDVESCPRCPRRSSLGVGTCRALEGSLYGELLGIPVHHQGGRFVMECTPVPFHDGAPSIRDGVIPPRW
jgi:hypothetical protein